MRALLDGDIYAFRSAASAENDDVGIAIWRLDEMIESTLLETSADSLSIFLSGGKNFRYDIYPEYKANRTAPKPRHLKELERYLIDKYSATVADGCEADDLLGIAQCSSTDTIICSLDKDLRMIPGNHYSFEISGTVKGNRWTRPAERVFVEPFDGLRHFYKQCLVGDTADNVKGVRGIGKTKAEKILAGARTERALFDATSTCFGSMEEFLMTAQVLWIWRKENDIWKVPDFETTERQG